MKSKKPIKLGSNTRWLGVKALKANRTDQHRPAIWENMLGTVYALSPERECKYFDYDYKAALAFAGVDPKNVVGGNRISRKRRQLDDYGWIRKGCDFAEPHAGQVVLWVLKEDKI